MRRIWIPALVTMCLVVGAAGSAFAQAAAAPAGSFVGAAKCKMCHNKPADGEQYKIWSASPHAKAFATLATPEAAEVAKKAGVTGNPQEAEQCLSCHTTGHAAKAELRGKVTNEEGVSCEACHGAGGQYSPMGTMKAIFAGTTPPASVGFVVPGEKTCTGCHNDKSPTFKGFDFAKYSEKIKHAYPAEKVKTRARK